MIIRLARSIHSPSYGPHGTKKEKALVLTLSTHCTTNYAGSLFAAPCGFDFELGRFSGLVVYNTSYPDFPQAARETFNVNLKGPVRILNAFTPILKQNLQSIEFQSSFGVTVNPAVKPIPRRASKYSPGSAIHSPHMADRQEPVVLRPGSEHLHMFNPLPDIKFIRSQLWKLDFAFGVLAGHLELLYKEIDASMRTSTTEAGLAIYRLPQLHRLPPAVPATPWHYHLFDFELLRTHVSHRLYS
ncbi:hypothetical protein Pelo_13266 [Pelomyxa schiedti]|nr:hypothetical protein Pelo_13266 [Pelomyxa schiedti]